MGKLYRQAAPSASAAFFGIMLFYSSIYISGAAGVQDAIGAFEDVDVPHINLPGPSTPRFHSGSNPEPIEGFDALTLRPSTNSGLVRLLRANFAKRKASLDYNTREAFRTAKLAPLSHLRTKELSKITN